MRSNKASWTAEISAIFRATESIRPEEDQVCHDPYARHFIRPTYRILLKSRLLALSVLWCAIERRFPGATGIHVARVRFIDDRLATCLDDGFGQVVILGAGYDTRAYRFDGLKDKKMFELDHPATQNVKKEKLIRLLGTLPGHVVYVPINFEHLPISRALFDFGYDAEVKTLFIWEGVSYYLSREAVDTVLAFVSSYAAKGSAIVFDYMDQSVVQGRSGMPLAEKMVGFQERKGEPFVFGLPPHGVEQFIKSRGFSQVRTISHDWLKRTYFKGRNKNRQLCPFWGIVDATV